MRKFSILCAASVVGAIVAAVPAKADYSLIRWQGTGFCQILDENLPIRPFPSNYETIGIELRTFGDALKVKSDLIREGVCSS